MEELISEVLSFWGIDTITSITKEYKFIKNSIDKNVWSINNEYILKSTEEEKEMKVNVIMACLLAREQIPAQRVVTLKNGRLYVYYKGRYYGVFTKIKGELIKDYFEGEYLPRAAYIGKSIGWLHHGLKYMTDELSYNKVFFNIDLTEEIRELLVSRLSSFVERVTLPNDEFNRLMIVFKSLEQNFSYLYKSIPRHVIHRELGIENLLFLNRELTGYIDFELSEVNVRLLDICYFSMSLLSFVFKDEVKRVKWLDFNKELFKAYNTKINLTENEIMCIPFMFYEIQVINIAKFYEVGNIDDAKKSVEVVNWLYKLFNENEYMVFN